MKKITLLLMLIILSGSTGLCGWVWHNPKPSGNGLNAVASDGSGSYVMAGEGGYLLEYANSDFNTPYFNTYQRVHDLEITSGGGIAACERADVLLLQNGSWVVDRPATTAWFYGAAATPGGDYFVCGDAGEIHRYSGGAWQELSSGTSSTLKDIDMFSDNRGWAVGLFGTARVWNGTSWQYYSSQTSRFLRGVSGSSDSNAWAVGDLGTITHWTGTGFQVETSGTSNNLYDVAAISDTEAWAVGDNGTVLHHESGAWNLYTHPNLPADVDFRSIVVNAADDIMIVGERCLIMHWDGSDWISLKTDELASMEIHCAYENPFTGYMLFGGDRGKIYEFDTVSFAPHVTGTNSDIYTITQDLGGDLWAGGHGGLLMTNDGTGWSEVNTGDTEDVRDIEFLASGDIWTAGGCDDGSCVSWAVLHYTGSSWVKYGESGS